MRFILRRLGFYLIAFWASITLNFLLPRFMPGDPVSRMFARSQDRMQPEQIEALRKLSLDPKASKETRSRAAKQLRNQIKPNAPTPASGTARITVNG